MCNALLCYFIILILFEKNTFGGYKRQTFLLKTKPNCRAWRLEDLARSAETVLWGLEINLCMRRLRRSFWRAHGGTEVCPPPPSYCIVYTRIIMKNRSVKFIYFETYIPVSAYIFLLGNTSPTPPRQVRGGISKQMSVDSCASA